MGIDFYAKHPERLSEGWGDGVCALDHDVGALGLEAASRDVGGASSETRFKLKEQDSLSLG